MMVADDLLPTSQQVICNHYADTGQSGPIRHVPTVYVSVIWGAAGFILYMRPANERRRYIVTPSLIGSVHTQTDP